MKLRITGTADECDAAVAQLRACAGFVVREASRFYPNLRESSLLGRVYIDVDLEQPPS